PRGRGDSVDHVDAARQPYVAHRHLMPDGDVANQWRTATCNLRFDFATWPLACLRISGVVNPSSPAVMHSNTRSKMARAARSALPTTETIAAGLPMSRAQLLHLRSAFRELLGQRSGKRGDQWRQSVLQSLRMLTGADKAILVVRAGVEPTAYADGVSRD